MAAYFLSDIHLKTSEEPNAQALERFLTALNLELRQPGATSFEAPTHLFLVGDIFDLWIGSHSYFRDKFERLIDLVRELVRAGVQVHFFEGNHDLHLEDFWQGEVGAQVHADPEEFELAGQNVRVEHGDQMNPEDRGYLFLRWLLRTKAVRALAMNLPSKVVAAIGERASNLSRNHPVRTATEEIRQLIQTHAKRTFAEKPFELLISGHVHVKDDAVLQAEGKTFRSVNLGSWDQEPHVFVLSQKEGRFLDLK